MSAPLPPGQTEIADFPRWGQVDYWPTSPSRPTISLGGDVPAPCELGLDDLQLLPRREQVSDFHCVTTWTRRGLTWRGFRLRDFYEQVLLPRCHGDGEARYIIFRGLDDYWTALPLEDALSQDVMLADWLDGEPLSIEHGAPLRVVAPAHYGYKSAKHLCAIDLARDPPGTRHLGEHERGLVALEERGQGRSGPEFRATYAPALNEMLAYFRKRSHRAQQPEAAPK